MIDDIGANKTAQSFDEAIRTGASHCVIEITIEAGTYCFSFFNREDGSITEFSKPKRITTIAAIARGIVNCIYYDFCFDFTMDEWDYFRQKLRTCIKEVVERTCFYLTDNEEPVRIEVFVNAIAKTDEAATN